jgi:hypothetical protein
MDDGQRAERMADKDDRAIGAVGVFDDTRNPVVEIRLVPVALLDTARGGQLLYPARVPVTVAAATEAGRDENVDV